MNKKMHTLFAVVFLFLSASVFADQNGPADKILIEKNARRLTVLLKGQPLRTYGIALGENPNGPKEREGDNKTPEGIYIIDSRNNNSRFHRSLHLSYPNEKDKKRAKGLSVPPGGNITIHGMGNGIERPDSVHQGSDSTKGCIAVTNKEIEEIWQFVPNGIIVEIRP
jgi:murein L,D-transpeptidase YafK